MLLLACFAVTSDAWECVDGVLHSIGFDYDGTMAHAGNGQACFKWQDVTDWYVINYGLPASEEK